MNSRPPTDADDLAVLGWSARTLRRPWANAVICVVAVFARGARGRWGRWRTVVDGGLCTYLLRVKSARLVVGIPWR